MPSSELCLQIPCASLDDPQLKPSQSIDKSSFLHQLHLASPTECNPILHIPYRTLHNDHHPPTLQLHNIPVSFSYLPLLPSYLPSFPSAPLPLSSLFPLLPSPLIRPSRFTAKSPHRTLDPLFALSIGIAAAGIRIRREENEKRAGDMNTTSMVSPSDMQKWGTGGNGGGAGGAGGDGGDRGKVGFGDIAVIGWGRVRRRVFGGVKGEGEGEAGV